MDFAKIDARLLSYPGSCKAFHEKWGWMVYWVGGKQFTREFTAKPTKRSPTQDGIFSLLNCYNPSVITNTPLEAFAQLLSEPKIKANSFLRRKTWQHGLSLVAHLV